MITTTGFLIGELLPELCVRAFTTDEELTDIAVRGMRIVVIFYPLIGMQMVTTNFFQSIGQASKSIFLSLTRQLLFLIPLLASVLGCKRSMVGHAYIRCHRMYSSRNHVNYSIQKI